MAKIMLAFVTVILVACSPTVQYIGRSYPPTTHVDIYFADKDVKKPYEVMGKIDGKGYEFNDFQKIQDRVVQEAQKKGADGVIISGMQEQTVGVSKNSTTTNTGQTTDNGNGYTGTSSTVTTTSGQTVRVLHAEFIKYTVAP